MDQFYNRKKSKVEVGYHKESTSNKPQRTKTPSLAPRGKRPERSSRIERHFEQPAAGESVWKKSVHLADSVVAESGIDKELLRQQRRSEAYLYGVQVCLAVFAKRPNAIVKAYFLKKSTPQFSKVLSWMAAQRKSYHVVDEAEMQKLSGSKHHEGVCFIIKKREPLGLAQYLAQQAQRPRELVVLLSGEQNPYNVGAVIRSAAFFNAAAVIAETNFSLDNGIVARIASGAAEVLQPVLMQDIDQTITALLEQGYQIIALNNSQGQSVKQVIQQKQHYLPKMAIILGHLPEHFLQNPACNCINLGEDLSASLNIANLFAIIATEWWRTA